jgi:GrpB-like predicted nucleotidyltransferase (UPF0157 family)
MIAKPIIDMILVIEPLRLETVRLLLEARGYTHEGDLGIPGREAFRLQDSDLARSVHPHHAYVCQYDSAELRRQVAFRQFLRQNSEYSRRPSESKWSLAERYANDRQAYTLGKASLCQEITVKAIEFPDLAKIAREA